MAALVPIEEVDLESLSLGTNPDFLALIEQSRARCQPRQRLAARRQPAR